MKDLPQGTTYYITLKKKGKYLEKLSVHIIDGRLSPVVGHIDGEVEIRVTEHSAMVKRLGGQV